MTSPETETFFDSIILSFLHQMKDLNPAQNRIRNDDRPQKIAVNPIDDKQHTTNEINNSNFSEVFQNET